MRNIILAFGCFAVLFSASAPARQFCADEAPLDTVAPIYPVVESPVGHSGYVVVEFIIDYKGEVVSPRVVEATSEPTGRFAEPFAKSALIALKKWKYEPRQIACEASQKFVFELTE